jgi:dihydropyrimidine dehydrogenase (NAD+) subunit PreT
MANTTDQRIPTSRSETIFEDYKPAYNKMQAQAEANRCLYCEDAPCITACPTGIDIPEFIRKISTDNVRGSAKTIFDSNILGMSCARVCPVEVLCVGSCVYNLMERPPIQIGKLQRYSTDAAFDADWQFYEAGADTGKTVGLVGGGPASLACAHELRRLGHGVTIYDRREVLGGLNTYGCAPHKIKSDRADEEVEWLLKIGGVELRKSTTVGDDGDVSWADLDAAHDAVFLGIGIGADKHLNLPNQDADGVRGCVDWIEQLKLHHVDVSGVTHAAVIGGGNTALDGVRELLTLGVSNVTMIYRGVEPGMTGYKHEWAAAKVQSATASYRSQPLAYEVTDGAVTGVRCQGLDANKKPIEGREYVVPAQLVLVAIGQGKLGHLLESVDGVQVDWGRIIVDEAQATGRPGWFAGGDCANGAKEVVNAVAEGRDAAGGIHAYLTSGQT